MEELDEGDSYEYIKHLTDVYRLHLFDVVMQYRAIFFDSAPTAKVGGRGCTTCHCRVSCLVCVVAAAAWHQRH